MKLLKMFNLITVTMASLRHFRQNSFKQHHGVDGGIGWVQTARQNDAELAGEQQRPFDKLGWILKKYVRMQGELSKPPNISLYNKYFRKYISRKFQ